MIPAGLLVTVPGPFAATLRLKVDVTTKVALTVVAAVMLTVQTPVPLHPPPLQPVKVEPGAGVAMSVTAVL